MKASRLGPILLYTAAAVILLSGAGVLDVKIDWRNNVANALDLFGSDAETKSAPSREMASNEAFWQENGSDVEPLLPRGVPASFADLAEHVSRGVVNIQTSKTVRGQAFPRFEDFFFGGPGQGGLGPQQERTVPSLGS